MTNEVKELQAIRFKFNERKTTSAAAYLLKLAGGEMPYMRLVKLLYLADRRSLLSLGRPISGDRFFAMKHGMVLSRVLDLIKNPPAETGPWMEHIERPGRYTVSLKAAPDLGPLSQAEMDVLREAFELYRTLDQWKLSQIMHRLPEWQDPKDSAIEVSPEEILRAAEKGEEEIEEARQDALEREYFDSIFEA